MDLGPPVGFTPTGDMTPFTNTNSQGDVVPFITNERGDIVPYALTRSAPTGDPAPFAFDSAGNRIPGVNEMYPVGGHAVPAAHSAHAVTVAPGLISDREALLLL
jgi:hypothetical protein